MGRCEGTDFSAQRRRRDFTTNFCVLPERGLQVLRDRGRALAIHRSRCLGLLLRRPRSPRLGLRRCGGCRSSRLLDRRGAVEGFDRHERLDTLFILDLLEQLALHVRRRSVENCHRCHSAVRHAHLRRASLDVGRRVADTLTQLRRRFCPPHQIGLRRQALVLRADPLQLLRVLSRARELRLLDDLRDLGLVRSQLLLDVLQRLIVAVLIEQADLLACPQYCVRSIALVQTLLDVGKAVFLGRDVGLLKRLRDGLVAHHARQLLLRSLCRLERDLCFRSRSRVLRLPDRGLERILGFRRTLDGQALHAGDRHGLEARHFRLSRADLRRLLELLAFQCASLKLGTCVVRDLLLLGRDRADLRAVVDLLQCKLEFGFGNLCEWANFCLPGTQLIAKLLAVDRVLLGAAACREAALDIGQHGLDTLKGFLGVRTNYFRLNSRSTERPCLRHTGRHLQIQSRCWTLRSSSVRKGVIHHRLLLIIRHLRGAFGPANTSTATKEATDGRACHGSVNDVPELLLRRQVRPECLLHGRLDCFLRCFRSCAREHASEQPGSQLALLTVQREALQLDRTHRVESRVGRTHDRGSDRIALVRIAAFDCFAVHGANRHGVACDGGPGHIGHVLPAFVQSLLRHGPGKACTATAQCLRGACADLGHGVRQHLLSPRQTTPQHGTACQLDSHLRHLLRGPVAKPRREISEVLLPDRAREISPAILRRLGSVALRDTDAPVLDALGTHDVANRGHERAACTLQLIDT